jgi:phosphopantothenoylcysteine synthetase/decarboxylase
MSTTATASDEGQQQLQQAMQQIEQHHHALTQSVAAFDQFFDGHSQTAAAPATDPAQGSGQLEQSLG